MFKRREKRSWWQTAQEALNPRKGWRRGFEYIGRRVQRLPDSPHRIALGLACGAMASFTPFFGLHFVIAAALAWAVSGNLLASAFGTFLGNPLTFPVIAGSSLWMGGKILHVPLSAVDFDYGAVFGDVGEFLQTIFVPYLVGGIAPGLCAAGATYFIARWLVAAYQNRRRTRLMARAKERMAAHMAARRAKKQAKQAAANPAE